METEALTKSLPEREDLVDRCCVWIQSVEPDLELLVRVSLRIHGVGGINPIYVYRDLDIRSSWCGWQPELGMQP